jgi:HD superfamily phosphohydrolase
MNLTQKIMNDPVYGFVTIKSVLHFKIIEHPYFQRLRRIKQLGLTDYVYPGAHHTRFHHAIGAMHLMQQAIDVLRSKGNRITHEEEEAVISAILLHDIGHGPFSHALEKTVVNGFHHEKLSILFMNELNRELNGELSLAIRIFENKHEKKFLHQLVSSQLDVDRLDYLNRDSFYTGVAEGTISADRIIKMLNVVDDQLVVEEKGIYSVENFIIARRLMYWQVYLHKTVLSAENMLVKLLTRAKQLVSNGQNLPSNRFLSYFLKNESPSEDTILHHFSQLDDTDIWSAAKDWQFCDDFVLSNLSKNLLNRNLLKIKIQNHPFETTDLSNLKASFLDTPFVDQDISQYFIFTGDVENSAYKTDENQIKILTKKGDVLELKSASEQLGLPVLSKSVKKFFLCYPKI